MAAGAAHSDPSGAQEVSRGLITPLLLDSRLQCGLWWSTDSALCDTNGPNMNGAVVKEEVEEEEEEEGGWMDGGGGGGWRGFEGGAQTREPTPNETELSTPAGAERRAGSCSDPNALQRLIHVE